MAKTAQIKFEIEQLSYNKIYTALKQYGDYEIGGMLLGHQKGRNHFSISDITIADDIGRFSIVTFIREPAKSMKKLIQLYKNKKYNYIGEWHSHPKFRLYPSGGDIETMQGILADKGYSVNFALLVIAKLNNEKAEMAGFLFLKNLSQLVQANISYNYSNADTINLKLNKENA